MKPIWIIIVLCAFILVTVASIFAVLHEPQSNDVKTEPQTYTVNYSGRYSFEPNYIPTDTSDCKNATTTLPGYIFSVHEGTPLAVMDCENSNFHYEMIAHRDGTHWEKRYGYRTFEYAVGVAGGGSV